MTTPYVTTLAPSTGLTSGRNVVIVRGIHFREVDLDSSVMETVGVTFNGEPADQVVPLARYVLHVVAPQYHGDPGDLPKAVDVVVTNLDDAGAPIPGESVTKVGAYTYRRPRVYRDAAARLDPTSKIDAVTLGLIQTLKMNVLPEVAISTGFDYSDDPSSGLTAVATLPAILLSGPNLSLDRDHRSNEKQESDRDDPEGSSAVTEPDLPFKVSWGIVVIANFKHLVTNATEALIRFFNRRPSLRVPTTAARTAYVERELKYGDFTASDRPSDNVYTQETTITVAPIYIDDNFGLADSGVPAPGEPTVFTTDDSDSFLELETTPHE